MIFLSGGCASLSGHLGEQRWINSWSVSVEQAALGKFPFMSFPCALEYVAHVQQELCVLRA